MGYYNQLLQFIRQSKTNNLKTKHYDSEYQGCKVKVSFGQGAQAKIPWIAFLKNSNTVSNGIYPVYLYYKAKDLLILAYGISETNPPQVKWDLDEKETIRTFFKRKNFDKPSRYGSSFIYKTYDINNIPKEDVINEHLNSIIDTYHNMAFEKESETTLVDIDLFHKASRNAGLIYPKNMITRFVASFLTKPFVILTGLSGSGKTKLAQAFVQWICKDTKQYCMVPVGADWTNREPLLGYPNALKPEAYVKPDSGVLDLILCAKKEPGLPHFLILDEMNLSQVERYFADFLSAMESKEEIPLYTGKTVENNVPEKLKLPSNLFIVGTVNIDETTNMFSPKVLDRANTIEFRIMKEEMHNFLDNIKPIDMKALTGKGAGMAESFLRMAKSKELQKEEMGDIHEALVKFFGELQKTGAEFGYRSATEILHLIHHLTVLDKSLTIPKKIDIAIMQKLLPKLHGSRRKLCPILETLGSFCVTDETKIIREVFENPDFDYGAEHVLYPLSLEKITRMYRAAIDNGFTSFAEA